jgi:hypothetical protein
LFNRGYFIALTKKANPSKKAFQVKQSKPDQRALDNRAAAVAMRLERSGSFQRDCPVIGGVNIDYQVSDRIQAINCGGIGAVHCLVQKLGLARAINESVQVLKRHLPYHESDHVLSVAYNILCGGSRIEDMEQLRQNTALLDALGAVRLPDPTTVGDFTRRFTQESILSLMECINTVRQQVWELQHGQSGREPGQPYFQEAVIDVDGTIAETLGGCKEGMDISFKGIWGYCPLVITLANTGEVLYLVNRPGNAVSQSEAPEWLERAMAVMEPHSERICLRGDSAFSLTGEFDGWDDRGIDFVFGMDSNRCFINLAEGLAEDRWQELERLPKYEVATKPRGRRERVKQAIVRERGYKNIRLRCEEIAEFWYRPGKCDRPYRVIAVRKNLSKERGDLVLCDEIRYFFYITNRTDLNTAEVVRFINGRGDQENLIEQMKNGVHAMKMPVDGLNGNWAYMVMASLAWNLKAWCGLLMPDEATGNTILRSEFRSFLQRFIMVPCQILTSGRRLVYRMLGYNRWLEQWLALARSLRPRTQTC